MLRPQSEVVRNKGRANCICFCPSFIQPPPCSHKYTSFASAVNAHARFCSKRARPLLQ